MKAKTESENERFIFEFILLAVINYISLFEEEASLMITKWILIRCPADRNYYPQIKKGEREPL